MSEIKFRGWHTVQKKMFSAEEMGADQLTLSVDGRGFVNVHGNRTELSTFYPIDKFIPMQFTGLRDKNGKEIYEGDILATSNADTHYDLWEKEDNGNTVVVWDADVDGWLGSKWSWDKNEDSIYSLGFIEVIGNIHENPELLRPFSEPEGE